MGWTSRGSVPGRAKRLIFFELSRSALRSTQPTLQRVLEASSPGQRRQALLHRLLSLRLYGPVPPLPLHAFVTYTVTSVQLNWGSTEFVIKESPCGFNDFAYFMDIRKLHFRFTGFLNPDSLSLTVILCEHSNFTLVLDFYITENHASLFENSQS
jgi:hypothetical protein